MKTKWVRRLACTGATLGLLLGASVPAEAGSDAYYRIKGTISEANDDVGGYDVQIEFFHNDVKSYFLTFWANDEVLHLMDMQTDDDKAEAHVIVLKNGVAVDNDHFVTGTQDWYELGTPDGSGDIPEGYRVKIKLCRKDYQCSNWYTGKA